MIFILGDFLVDVGNNNYIFILVVVNYKLYGIDRVDKVVIGRFCNGKIIFDFVSKFCLLLF